MTRRSKSLSQIFGAPFVIGIATTLGLVAALVGDGVWDIVGYIGLVVPVTIAAWCVARAVT